MWKLLLRVILGTLVVAAIVIASATSATIFATRQLRTAMERSAVEMQGHLATPQIADPVTLDFYEATGIKQTDLMTGSVNSRTNSP